MQVIHEKNFVFICVIGEFNSVNIGVTEACSYTLYTKTLKSVTFTKLSLSLSLSLSVYINENSINSYSSEQDQDDIKVIAEFLIPVS